MAKSNLIGNHDFAAGKDRPTGWTWQSLAGRPSWRFGPGRDGSVSRSVVIHADDAKSVGAFERTVRVKGSTHYRVEAMIRVACTRHESTGGLALDLVAREGDRVLDDSPGCGCAADKRGWTLWRRYYQTPENAKQLDVRVTLRGVEGQATIDSVRVVQIEEPEVCSHPLAVPPPPHGYPAPRRSESVIVFGDTPAATKLAELIGLRLGADRVHVRPPKDALTNTPPADAMIFPSTDRPPGRLTLGRLHRLAENATVVIGLEAFAALADKTSEKRIKTRRIEQDVEPPHARVGFGNFITRGFALNDVFPYWWNAARTGVYVQRVLHNTPALRKFTGKAGYETILFNEGETDASSGHPLCLFKPTEQGGVLVLDTDPIVTQTTSEDESTLPLHLLFNGLGMPQSTLGQFIVPNFDVDALAEELDDMGRRFPAVRVHRVATDDPRRWIEIGGMPEGFGLPMALPPVILIRTGARTESWDGVYGALLWIKNLFRPPPFTVPYTPALLAKRRIAWTPVGDPDHWGKFSASNGSDSEMMADFDPGSVAAVIDVVSTDTGSVRLVVPELGGPYRKYACSLGPLAEAMLDGRHLFYAAGQAETTTELNGTGFLLDYTGSVVTAEPGAFETELYRAALTAGAECLRLELPGDPCAGPTHSIRRTDRAALLIEWIVGLQIGMIVVNRDAEPMDLRVPVHMPTGARVHILNGDTTAEPPRTCPPADVGTVTATLAPGAALVLERM